MVKEFSIENHLSIDTMQTISFEATSDRTHQDDLVFSVAHPVTGSKTKILKMTAIYGANASGKTNLIIALEEVFRKLLDFKQTKEEKIRYFPFGMKNDRDTYMKVCFFINGIEYSYEISFNEEVIKTEKMRFNPNGVTSLFYERKYDDVKRVSVISFGENVYLPKADRDHIIKETKKNQTVLATYIATNIYAQHLATVENYVKKSIKDSLRKEVVDLNNVRSIIKTIVSDEERKKIFFDDISSAGFNIKDIIYKEVGLPNEFIEQINTNENIPPELKSELLARKLVNVDIVHGKNSNLFTLPLDLESRGTLRYFEMSDAMYDMMSNACVYMIDEIENAIHYDLLVLYLKKFILNEHNSQLIFATHDQLLLDEEFIRRDMVWFTEKNEATSATEVYSASDFGYHKNVSMYKLYKVGKFGAKPSIGSPFVALKSNSNE